MKRLLVLLVAVSVLLPVPAAGGPTPVPTGRIAVLAFADDETLIVTMDPDGSDRHVVFTSQDHPGFDCVSGLDLSQDGTKIVAAFCPRRMARLYTLDVDGSNFQRIGPRVESSGPEWSPDGTHIAFTGFDENFRSDIYVMDADGTDVQRLTSGSEPEGSDPTWAPDGSEIAFVAYRRRTSRLMVMDATGTSFRVLFRGSKRLNISSPEWSPDESTIAFVDYNRNGIGDLWTIGADGSDPTKLTDTDRRTEEQPKWSPDGTWLAYLAYGFSGGGLYDVFVALPDGSSRSRIRTSDDEVGLSWGGDQAP